MHDMSFLNRNPDLVKVSVTSMNISLLKGLGSNPGEDLDICKRIVPSRHGGTLNSCRAASPLTRLWEGEERREAPDHSQSVLPQNWGKGNRVKSYCRLHDAQSQD
ncbi:uncharacterized protein TNCV_1002641 [Trichonephila clavipes]|nr:uncharacterized protein TNCV_1002641 [Trichonephila clavipes]